MTMLLLAKHEDGLFLLSERFPPGTLGKQRAMGGRNEPPNMVQSLINASALRMQSSAALDPVRGNCRRKRHLDFDEQQVKSLTIHHYLRESMQNLTNVYIYYKLRSSCTALKLNLQCLFLRYY